MSGSINTGGGGRGNANPDFELNLASIIDCFTVLIAFMLASASFLSIGILDAGVAAAGATASDTKPADVQVSMELKKDKSIQVKVTGKGSHNATIRAWTPESLNRELASVKSRWPGAAAVTLTAENAVEYKEVVQVMDITRKTLPNVLLGGF